MKLDIVNVQIIYSYDDILFPFENLNAKLKYAVISAYIFVDIVQCRQSYNPTAIMKQ